MHGQPLSYDGEKPTLLLNERVVPTVLEDDKFTPAEPSHQLLGLSHGRNPIMPAGDHEYRGIDLAQPVAQIVLLKGRQDAASGFQRVAASTRQRVDLGGQEPMEVEREDV